MPGGLVDSDDGLVFGDNLTWMDAIGGGSLDIEAGDPTSGIELVWDTDNYLTWGTDNYLTWGLG